MIHSSANRPSAKKGSTFLNSKGSRNIKTTVNLHGRSESDRPQLNSKKPISTKGGK